MWDEAESQRLRMYEFCTTCTIAASCRAHDSALLAHLSIATFSQWKSVDPFCSSKKAVQVHGWLQFVVHCLQPFQVVEDPKFTEHIRYESLTQKPFKKYLEKLTKIVEEKIRNILPDIFAIVFDGWTTSDSHYIAIICTLRLQMTVLVTLLRCIVNCTAYPIQELCGPFPQKQGLGLKGTRMAFSNIDGESVEGMKSN